MKIDEKGYSLSTADEILSAYEKQLQQKFGSDFYIKPEGVIDNIVNSSGVMEIDLQEQIASLAKQFDPEASEDNWQDALYERIGVSRLDEQATVFKKKILGTAGYAGAAGAVTIRSKSTNDEFVNTSDFTIEDDGTAEIEFECVVAGAVSVNASDSFVIVEGPNEVTGISSDDAVQIAIGRERESDSDFRLRFRNSKAQNARATRNANEANLLKYVDNIAFLKIIDKKTDNSFDAGTIKIIAKHNTTDENFAKAVFDSVADGIDLLGDTSVIVKDNSGQDVTINWKNADEINLDIKATVKVRNGYYPNTVFANVKQNILAYIEKRVFGLQSIVYATEFIIPVLEVDGVEAVVEILVKKSSDEEFSDNISLSREEVPAFASERITLNEPA